MTDPLQSARIKLKRANLHAGIARREARRFYAAHPEPRLVTVEVEPEGDWRDLEIGSHFAFQLVVAQGWPDLPDSFAARFGDAIHNYRSALDHVSWQLAIHGDSPPWTLKPQERKRIQFPIYDTEKAFLENVGRRLPGVHRDVWDFIQASHQYVGGQATNDALLSLNNLSNDDKHKTLIQIGSAFANVEHRMTFESCRYVAFRNPEIAPHPKKGAVVATVECIVTGTDPKVTMETHPAFHITLEDGRGFGNVLNDIRREVLQILDAPEITRRLH